MNLVLARKAYFSAGKNSSESRFGEGCNYCLEVFIEGSVDPISGLVVNLIDVQSILDRLLQQLDHKHLNREVEEFHNVEVSAPLLAQFCYEQLSQEFSKLKNEKLKLVGTKIYEGEEKFGTFFPSANQ